jgi:hypothetical protein
VQLVEVVAPSPDGGWLMLDTSHTHSL